MPEDNGRVKGRAASASTGAMAATAEAELPPWVTLDARLRWWSESQQKFMAVRVTKVDESKRLVIVTFEADAKVWKSVPFSQLTRRNCPLQRAEDTGGSTAVKQKEKTGKEKSNSAKKDSSKGAIHKEPEKESNARKEVLERDPATSRKEVNDKEATNREPTGRDSSARELGKEGDEEEGTSTPNWWVMEKARLMDMDEIEKREKEEMEKRKKEKEDQEQRLEEKRRREVLAAERRKVEEAFERRKKEAEEQRLRAEEEWRNQLRLRREREAAEEQEREQEREARRKKRQEEKGKKKAKEEADKQREVEEKEQQELIARRLEEAQRLASLPGLAAVQPWAGVAQVANLQALTAAAASGASPSPVATAVAAGWRLPPGAPVATNPWGSVAVAGLGTGVGPAASADAFAGLKATARPHAALVTGVPPPPQAVQGLPLGLNPSPSPSHHAVPLVPSPGILAANQRLPPQTLFGALPQPAPQSMPQGPPQERNASWVAGWGTNSNQDTRELLNVLHSQACMAGNWANGQPGWAGQ